MRYGSRLNTVLLVLLAATVALSWHLQRESAALRPQVAELDWSEVARITIELRDRDPLHFQRGPGGWSLDAPLGFEAEARRLREVVHALNVPSQAQYTTREADPAELGLDEPPVARVVVDGAEYRIGIANPVTGWRYLQHGDAVHLVHDVLYFRLLGPPHSWASRQPLSAGAGVVRIDVDGVTLADDAMRQVAAAWADAYAYQVGRYDGDGDFDRRVRIWLDGTGAPIEFGLTLTETGLIAVRTDVGVEYQLPADGAERLWRAPDAG